MGIFFGWIIFSLIVGAIGSNRKIGFWGAFFLSLILSPVIGLIIALVSKDKDDEEYKQKLLHTQQRQQETLSNLESSVNKRSLSEELEKIKKMKDEGLLSDEEFQKAKEKILSSN
jgi:phosphate/sulfate permease